MKAFNRQTSILFSIVLSIIIFSPLAKAQSDNNYDMYPQPVKEVLTCYDKATYYANLMSSDASEVQNLVTELGKLKNYTDSQQVLSRSAQKALAKSIINLTQAYSNFSGEKIPDDLYEQVLTEIQDDPVLGHIVNEFYQQLGL